MITKIPPLVILTALAIPSYGALVTTSNITWSYNVNESAASGSAVLNLDSNISNTTDGSTVNLQATTSFNPTQLNFIHQVDGILESFAGPDAIQGSLSHTITFTAEGGDVLSFAGDARTSAGAGFTINDLTDTVVLSGPTAGDLINKSATGALGFDNSGFSTVALIAGEVYTYTRTTVIDVSTVSNASFGGTSTSGAPHTLTLTSGTFTNAIAVPEPSSSVLLGLGSIILLSFRKRG